MNKDTITRPPLAEIKVIGIIQMKGPRTKNRYLPIEIGLTDELYPFRGLGVAFLFLWASIFSRRRIIFGNHLQTPIMA